MHAYEEATILEDRITKLEKFISLIPKHKSSEKMVAHYRHRLTVLRQEVEERRARRKMAKGGPTYSLAKEGAGQVVLVGLASSGKSTLLNRLTGAKAKIGDYEFTTQLPEPGVFNQPDDRGAGPGFGCRQRRGADRQRLCRRGDQRRQRVTAKCGVRDVF